MANFKETIAVVTLAVVYLASRLTYLTRLPVFIDEAIHIGWARETLAGHWEAGMLVGKWLPVKIIALFMATPLDPLAAARLGSVAAGMATLIPIVLIGRVLFSRTEGYLAGLLYILIPFALMYDRLALADSYLTAFGAWAIVFSVRAVVLGGRLSPWLLATTLVAAVLSKLTGALYLAIPLLAVLLLLPRDRWAKGLRRMTPALLPALIVVVYLVRQQAGTQLVGNQAAFEIGIETVLRVLENSVSLAGWLWTLLTPPLAALGVASLVWAFFHRNEPAIAFLAAVFALALAVYVVVSSIWFPRYILFALVPLTVLLARFVVALVASATRAFGRGSGKTADRRALGVALFVLSMLLLWPAIVDVRLVVDPPSAALPPIERWQYVAGWPSGYGIPELAADLESLALASDDGINVMRFDFWSPPNQSLDVYLKGYPSLHVHTLYAGADDLTQRIDAIANQRRTYFVSGPANYGPQLAALGADLSDLVRPWTKVGEYKTPDGQTALELWRVDPVHSSEFQPS